MRIHAHVLDHETNCILIQDERVTVTHGYGLREFPINRMSTICLSFVRACLKTCIINHSQCRPSQISLPTRLIDVGGKDSYEVRLVDSSDLGNAKYVALSYCWGNAVSLTTTTLNIDALKSGIALWELPALFRDAVEFVRELGIQFLWVDALCIIQDSRMDWEIEASKMAKVYSNALLTLAISSSDSADQGFLRQGSPDQYVDARGLWEAQPLQFGDWRARYIPLSGIHLNRTRRLDPRDNTWSSRGWTLQEQVLSKRLLIFSQELQWSCQERQFCECQSFLNKHQQFGDRSIYQLQNAQEAFHFWQMLVEDYSRRKFTYADDKLPGISGVAQAIKDRTSSAYVAGLWKDNMYLDLLWQRKSTIPAGPTPNTYIAPSFSWASIEGEVHYGHTDLYSLTYNRDAYTKVAAVLSIQARTSGDNPYGQVTSGQLVLRGPLVRTCLWPNRRVAGQYYVLLGNQVIDLFADREIPKEAFPPQEWQLTTGLCVIREILKSLGSMSQEKFLHARPAELDIALCWALHLGYFPPIQGTGLKKRSHVFLILGEARSTPGVYERLGIAKGIEAMRLQWDELSQTDEPGLWKYQNKDELDMTTISRIMKTQVVTVV